MNEKLECNKDTCAEAKEQDENATGVYRVIKQLDAGHFPIELSRLMKYFLKASTEYKLVAQVTGKRKREIGLLFQQSSLLSRPTYALPRFWKQS